MIGYHHSKTSGTISKECRQFFGQRGWKVSGLGDLGDMRIDKGIFKFNIEFVDESINDFKSSEQLIELMDAHIRRARTSIPVFFISNFTVPYRPFDTFLDHDIIVFGIDELDLIGALGEFFDKPDQTLTKRQTALISLNTWACIKISQNLKKEGDTDQALVWAKRAIKPHDVVSGSHHLVFDVLMQSGDVDSAYKLASDAVARKKDELGLLKKLHSIALSRHDEAEAKRWRQMMDEIGANMEPGTSTTMDKILGTSSGKVSRIDQNEIPVKQQKKGPLTQFFNSFIRRGRS